MANLLKGGVDATTTTTVTKTTCSLFLFMLFGVVFVSFTSGVVFAATNTSKF